MRRGGDRWQDMLPHAAKAARLLRAIGNEQRLVVLCHLTAGELSVSELNRRIPLSQSALSQHLAVLRAAGVVSTRRASQMVYYKLRAGPAARVVAALHRSFCR